MTVCHTIAKWQEMSAENNGVFKYVVLQLTQTVITFPIPSVEVGWKMATLLPQPAAICKMSDNVLVIISVTHLSA